MLNVVLDIFYQPNTDGYDARKVNRLWTNDDINDIMLNVYYINDRTTLEIFSNKTSEVFSMTFKSDDIYLDFLIRRLREMLQSTGDHTLRIDKKQDTSKDHTVRLFTSGVLEKELEVHPVYVLFATQRLEYEE